MSVLPTRGWSAVRAAVGALVVVAMLGFVATPSFASAPVPAVAGVSPSSGVAAGGGTVTVTGSGFTGSTGVVFGGTAATNVVVVSPTQISATVPAHAAGVVDVQVVGAFGNSPVVAADHYTYQPVPAVASLSPSIGVLAGGTTLTVTGSGFIGVTGVTVGGTAATHVVVSSSTQLTLTLPAESAGVVDIRVTGTYGTSPSVSGDHYTYQAPPVVTWIAPAVGVAAGGGTVTVTGTGFVGITKVTVDGITAAGLVVTSPTQLTFTPPAHALGAGGVEVTKPLIVVGAYGSSDPSNIYSLYEWSPPPTVSGVSPTLGPLTGGGTVVISGQNVAGLSAVLFGTTPATIQSFDQTSVTVTVPAHAAGVVDVHVVLGNGTSVSVAADQYTYEPIPAVTALAPTVGVVAGGNTVTVTGTGFVGITGVTVGGVAAASFTVVSATQLTFVVPAGSPGVVAVQIVGPYGTSHLVSADHYTYQAAPAVTAVSPPVGVVGGSGSVTITGTGFVSVTKVLFGTTAATGVVVVSPTQLTVTPPAHAAGTVDVTVVGTYGTSPAAAADQYSYGPIPAITSLDSSAGVLAGGGTLTITGSGFLPSGSAGATGVLFGSTPGTGVVVISGSSLTVTIPAHAAGLVDVRVVLGNGTSPVVSADQYTYQPAPAVTAVAPAAGRLVGGNTVTVTGTGFNSVTTVNVGGVPATSFVVVSATQLTFVAPVEPAGVVDVQIVSNFGTSAIVAADHYTYQPVPSVTSVTPNAGVLGGANTVTVTGSGFISVTKVQFGTTLSPSVTVVSPTQLTVTVPAHVAGTVNIQVVGTYGTSPVVAADHYTFEPVPVVSSLSSSAGVLAGGSTLTITGSGFISINKVSFGTVVGTNVVVVSPTQLTVTVPAGAVGLVDVQVFGAYGTSLAVAADQYTYEPAPAITAVAPSAGVLVGANTVTVTGSGFVGITGVTVGGTAATSVAVVSSTQLTFVAPAGSAGTVDVQVIGSYGTSPLVTADHYKYQPVPAVTSVSPSTGVLGGANTITVHGSGFTSITQVTVGGVAATALVVSSTTKLTVTVPAHAAGTVDVRVVGTYGTSPTTAADHYTYEPVPAVTIVSPNAGDLAGGNTVTITGSGFISVTQVSFGSTLGTNLVVVSSTQLTVTAPAHAAGSVDVQVIGSFGTSPVAANDQYLYESAGSIAGVVTGAGSSAVPLSGVSVSAYDGSGVFAGSTLTDASGAYTVTGLGTGTYTLDFAPGDTSYAPQWFSGQTLEGSATPIALVVGQALTGKNVLLTRSASISGSVAGDSNVPLTDVGITAYDAVGNYAGGTVTDGSGNYTIDGLAAGSYVLYFAPEFGHPDSSVYAPQWFSAALTQATATRIALVAGQASSGDSVALTAGASVSGTVTDAAADTIAGVQVDAYNSSGTWVAGAQTDGSGNYTVTGLAAGSYALKFTPQSPYAPQWWNGAVLESSSTLIPVAAGGAVTGNDVVLAQGATIAGTVTNASSAGLTGVEVDAYDSDGNWVSSVLTDGSGSYQLNGLAADSYTLDFTPPSGSFAAQWWNDQPTQVEATPISLTEGQLISGEDVLLAGTGSISGNVTGSGATLVTLTGVVVTAFDPAGNNVGTATTDAFGHYTLSGLPTGSYTLEFAPNTAPYGTEWWNGAVTQGAATYFGLAEGQAITGENITLHGGSIAGNVTGVGSPNIPLAGIYVDAVDALGNGIGFAVTDSSGNYAITGLAAGSYTLEFAPLLTRGYAAQWYSGQLTQATASYLTVTPGVAITGKNAVLASTLGSISGTVTGNDNISATDPLVWAEVDAFDAGGNFIASGTTDMNGAYTITGLPAGSYKVFASDYIFNNQYADQWWTTTGSKTATQSTASSVVLAVAGTRTVNFSLAQNSTISGTVFGADAPTVGVQGVQVEGLDASGNYVYSTQTDSQGHYTIIGFRPGTYTLEFGAYGQLPNSAGGTGLPYARQWYSGKSSQATATPIVVGNQVQLVGKNVTLSVGSTITGHVNYLPLDGATVSAIDSTGFVAATATADTSGNYQLVGLVPGTYTLDFNSLTNIAGDVDWWYNANTTVGAQLTVTLTGATLVAPTVSLVIGGSITGTVYGAGSPNVPLADVDVTAFDSNGEEIGLATTDSDGTYTMPVPLTGSYTLDFNNDPNPSSGEHLYVGEWLGGQTTEAAATVVPVTAGQSVPNQDIVLPLGATISGSIVGSGTPNVALQFAEVDLYDAQGHQVNYALTDALGNYTLSDLPAGDYTLHFLQNEPYAAQWLGNQATEQTATVISVANAQTLTNENAVLALGSSISGTVVGLASPNVALSQWQAAAYDTNGNLIGTGVSNDSGQYTIDSLPAGTYSVGFTDLASDNSLDATYAAQWYKGQPSEATATPITVSGGQTVTGKSVVLVPGGIISGTLFSAGNVPAQGYVYVYDAYGTVAGSGFADHNGRYAVESLPPGSYTLEFVPWDFHLASQWYGGQSTQATSTPVTVVSGQTSSGKNGVFSTGASISGVVTDNHGLKLDGMKIPVWQLQGSTYVEQTALEPRTDGNGNYTIGLLPAGTYKVGFEDYATGASMPSTVYGPSFWNNAPTLGSATPITVTGTQAVTGVSAVLTKLGALASLTAEPQPTITGTAKVGSVLTATPGTWAPAPVVLTYQWLDNGNLISGATSSTFTPTGVNVGHKISVVVTGQKVGFLTAASPASVQTAKVTS